MRLLNVLRELKRNHSAYQPLVLARISKSALINNYQTLQSAYSGLKLAPVLKSNAYGHGLREVARVVDKLGAPFLVVDSPFEAGILRGDGIKTKILVMGYVKPESLLKSTIKNASFTIVDLEQLVQADRLGVSGMFHLKIDTGMHRQGILLAELETALNIFKKSKKLVLEGAFTHLADPIGSADLTADQANNWSVAGKKVKQFFPNIEYLHVSSTSGLVRKSAFPANVARVGIGLYGIAPLISSELNPVLELTTLISGIKTIEAGEQVGYNGTFTALAKTKIATLPLGYFEGVDLRLSSRGLVKINGKFCPIVGRVSMNITTIDVTSIPDVKVGQSATIISNDESDPNSVLHIAEQCNTIPYEILVHIPQHIRRQVE